RRRRRVVALRVGHRQVLHDAAVAGGDQHGDAVRRRGQFRRVLRGDLGRPGRIGGLTGAVADRHHVGQVVAGDELHALHDLRHGHVFLRATGYLGVGRGGRDDDLRVGRDQVGRYHVQVQFALPRVARPVTLQLDHARRALGRQRARRVDRLDLRVRQPEYLVEHGDLPVDVQEVPALHDRDGGTGAVDALAPQCADVVVEDVFRAGVDLGELRVVLL